MRNCLTTWLAVVGGAGLCLAAHAVSPGLSRDQFQNIPERNVFGLKSGEAEQPSAPKGPPPRLTLTGITTLLGNKLALLRAALPAGPGQPAQEKPLMLSEGQRDGNIEVLEINEQQRSVRVNDAGEIMTLTFAKNGVKPPAGAATAAVGTPPANAPASPFIPGLNTRMRVMPMRVPRTTIPGAAPETGASATGGVVPGTGAASTAGTAAGTVPATTPSATDTGLSPTGRTAPTNSPEVQAQQDAEAQAVLQALQQIAAATNATPAPPPPAPPSPRYSPYPVMPPGANLQRPRPPFYPQ